jgi:prepilin-type N-terminal cleavage/methylation domain-containing protein
MQRCSNDLLRTLRSRGFTLIELLVVIAIIGILSSVVLVSLNTARSKGNDASVKANLGAVRTQAELYYNDAGALTYGDELPTAGACPTSGTTMFYEETTIRNAIATALTNGSGLNACQTDDTTSGDATKWAVVSQYKSDPLKGWCIDNSGKAKEVTIATNNQAGLSAELSGGQCVE